MITLLPETRCSAENSSKMIFQLITFIYLVFIQADIGLGYDRHDSTVNIKPRSTTVKYNQTALINLSPKKAIMQNPLKWGQFNLELDFVSSTCPFRVVGR